MVLRLFVLTMLSTCLCFGQGLPDRDELVKKFLDDATSADAAKELLKHFQMGGLRTIIRNLDEIPYERALGYGVSLRYIDLDRFRNDLNSNLKSADGPQRRALFLMLLSTIGRGLASSEFEPYIVDETQPLYVRLAALSAIIKVQNPARYDRFIEMAGEAEVNPETGKDDLRFADITKKNLGFWLYTKGKVDDDQPNHGAIISALAMCEANDEDLYQVILDKKRWRKYYPLMIDRAVKVGGVNLLEMMAAHKSAKKFRTQISAAIPAAQAIAEYRSKFVDKAVDGLQMGPVFNLYAQGAGVKGGYRGGYAVAKVDASGAVSMVTHQSPFGGTDSLSSHITGSTFPAHNKEWQPVESYVLVIAP